MWSNLDKILFVREKITKRDLAHWDTTIVAPLLRFVRGHLLFVDPPEGIPFPEVRDFALVLRPIIESFRYRSFVRLLAREAYTFLPLFPDGLLKRCLPPCARFLVSHLTRMLHVAKTQC